MKTNSRILCLLLALCLCFSNFPLRAYALEDDGAAIDTAEKLIEAIEAADYGDVITIAPPITLENISLSTDKNITLVRDNSKEEYLDSPIFILRDGAGISGFNFSDDSWSMGTVMISGIDIAVENCSFRGNDKDYEYTNDCIFIRRNSSAQINSCVFSSSNGHALRIEFSTNISIDDCTFADNARGSIDNGGNVSMNDCFVICGEPLANNGTLRLFDCVLEENSSSGKELDIWNSEQGTLHIFHSEVTDRAYIDLDTGEMIDLPFHSSGAINLQSVLDETPKMPKTIKNSDDLHTALILAEEGQTLVISGTVGGNGGFRTTKNITLVRDENFTDAPMFRLYSQAVISGFTIIDNAPNVPTVETHGHLHGNYDTGVKNCSFYGDGTKDNFIHIVDGKNSVVENVNFSDCGNISVLIEKGTTTTISNCNFSNNGGNAIYNAGQVTITDCDFTENSTEKDAIFSNGTISISHSAATDIEYYTTSGKLTLPYYYPGTVSITSRRNPDIVIGDNPDNEDDNNPTNPETPEEPGTDDNNNPTDPPENPEDTESGEPAPADNDNTENSNTQDTTPDEPEQPITPPSSRGNTTHYLTPTPTQPMGTPIEDEPEEQPTKVIPALTCNGAALDTSRKVVLQGYGNGALYENDALTRAQAATIIYRLLDSDSLAALEDVAPIGFLDVDSAAWYAPYVQTISKAGIVTGIGAGHFAPDEALTWAQLITVLTRFVTPQECTLQHVRYPSWAAEAMQTAAFYGWIADNPYFNANRTVSRGDAALYINYIMELSRLQ